MVKSTKLGHRTELGIAGNAGCVGVGALVSDVHHWLVPTGCECAAAWWWCVLTFANCIPSS